MSASRLLLARGTLQDRVEDWNGFFCYVTIKSCARVGRAQRHLSDDTDELVHMTTSTPLNDASPYLNGKLLIAMPTMSDDRFAKTVIYLCAHNKDGAMGIVVNRPMNALTMKELLGQLSIEPQPGMADSRVHFGGPVETSRGFLLHTTDRMEESSLRVEDDVALTSTIDILKAIASGEGPRRAILALGYAGWGAGQLDNELQQNSWLHVEADETLLFDNDLDSKWARAFNKIGFDPHMLSVEAGHA
jgi:putative transcriptional regulator